MQSPVIAGNKVNGEPKLTYRDSVCALLSEIFLRPEPSVFPASYAEGGEEIPPLQCYEIGVSQRMI